MYKKAAAHSGFPTYELHTLGWKAFQDLCSTILSEIFGQTFQIFSPGHDGGRDGAFQGQWIPQDNSSMNGAFTAQCKFTSSKSSKLTLAILKDDLAKAELLAKKGLADNYLLLTNHKLSGRLEGRVRQGFQNSGVRTCLVYGEEKLCQLITEYPRLRRLVPRIYGLGDLSQILDERAYDQAQKLLLSLQDDLAKFVPTASYRRSAKALSKHGFVLLLGEPASGKSTIAATLALSAADEWKCNTVKVESASLFKDRWNPQDPRQFFWIDDAFGVTQYQADLVHEWNRRFPELQAAIKDGARVVFTSRDYIYRRAKDDLKDSAFPLLNESQVIINVEELTLSEKQEILYNHVKRGDQPKEFRRHIKPYLDDAAKNPHFQPEIARRLGLQAFTKELVLSGNGIEHFIESPEAFLLSVINGFGPDEKSALALIFMHGGALESPIIFTQQDLEAIARIGSSKSGVVKAMNSMKDSLVKLEHIQTGKVWVLKHPTIADAFASLVASDHELLDIYLQGATSQKLLKEVVCGGIQLEGAKVVVPPSRYDLIIQRLDNLLKDSEHGQRLVDWFLTYRCSKDFLQTYVASHPTIFDRVSRPGAYLYAHSEVNLAVLLDRHGLLPAAFRSTFVARVKELAISIPDPGFLTIKDLKAFLTRDEIRNIMDAVEEEVIPKLEDTIEHWKSDYSQDDDPEQYFSHLTEALRAYKEEIADQQLEDLLNEAEERIDLIVQECRLLKDDAAYKYSDLSASDTDEREDPNDEEIEPIRSIFDDLDE